MTAITASLVKELRERTGAGMMECKKALTAANGDIEVAITDMRKSGQLKAAKRAGRVAAEGLIVIAHSDDHRVAVMVEINTETDFSAKDESVRAFADKVADVALAQKVDTAEALLATDFDSSDTVEAARTALVAKVGENIQIRRVTLLESDGVVGSYLHGSKIGVLAALDKANMDLSKDIAMHVAASNPKAISADDIPADLVAKEKEIYMSQAADSGKPADIIEKMIQGKLNKFLKEQSLMGQAFVKDPNQSVADLLKVDGATVAAFTRYEVGEGIEKKESNFAEEVMAQVQGG